MRARQRGEPLCLPIRAGQAPLSTSSYEVKKKNGISFFSESSAGALLAVECRWICSSSSSVRLPKRSSRPEFARFCQENWPREARDRAGPRCARLIVADAGGAFISLGHSAPACSLFVVRLNFEVRCRRRAPAQQGKKKAREALQEERQAPCKKSCCMSRSRTSGATAATSSSTSTSK